MVSEYHPIPEMMQQREGDKKPTIRLPKHPPPSRLRNITIIGMPAAGKSTVAKALSGIMHREWLEADAKIEETNNMSITDIIQKRGEPFFRKQETQTLTELLLGEKRIISTGGGAILAPENRKMLKTFSWVVYLSASLAMLAERVEGDSQQRPLLGEQPHKKLAEAQLKREPLYQQTAHVIIVQRDTDTPARIARKIEAGLKHLIPV